MKCQAEKAVIDKGVRILYAEVENIDNTHYAEGWKEDREKRIEAIKASIQDLDVHADPILEGYNLLHDAFGVKRRKTIPASENLIRLVRKNGDLFSVNQAVDIYNLISLESKLALGAHDIDHIDGNFTLRLTDGSESFIPIGQSESIGVKAGEYCYCDDSNAVLCRLEVRQVEKTKVTEETRNIVYIVQGNEATPYELLRKTAEKIIADTTKYCGGNGKVIEPGII